MKNFTKLPVLALILAFTLTSCARQMGNSTYVDSASTGIVYEGVIISARPVTIKSSDKLGEKPGVGMLGGGVLGGIGGSNIGKGKGSSAAAVGGALAGAVVGAMVEDALNTQQGMEYIVKLDDSSLDDGGDEFTDKSLRNPTVSQQIRGSTKLGMKSRAISVIQGVQDGTFSAGTRVFVIYNDDRPRVVPATY